MTEAVRKYRTNNPKCVFCVHLDTRTPNVPGVNAAWWCRAKMKNVEQKSAYRLRPFCTCYDVKDEK